ncbi:hypothetical protein BGZ80_009985 [Entomortierella chlamydospora]|uniref:C2H2-type domain-containing protein n=1 Tax=Entomortierella chlamydospora TaxID=101097 RepID=A0A9P6N422_9FUNG|nr:hypothetical protein BGZ80_009985 [Entomortierella chlamydospora]
MQILGNHPASPGSGMFLDLPSDPFLPVRRGNFLFTDYNSSMMTGAEHHLLQYPAASSAPAVEDSQASREYMYAQQPMIKSEFSNGHFAAMAPNYMMSMDHSFPDGQLSQICGSAVSGVASIAVKTEMCDSPLMYAVNSNNNFYSTQPQHHNHHHHNHRYSTSSLSAFSDSSMSPRSTLSSSNNSITSYPLSRTSSEPLSHQGIISTSSSMSDLAKLGNESDTVIAAVKPTPKRSRGRRVSSHPDNSGCKVFTCRAEDCGKIFKRSEHLKRHVRSIHTLEKPFPCPILNCPKRFSRSDNLNQHIRIHRHNSGRCIGSGKNKDFVTFTPFLQTYPTDFISL